MPDFNTCIGLMSDMKKKYGKLITNIYPGVLSDEQEVELFSREKAIFFVVQEPFRKRGFFAAADQEVLIELLSEAEKGCVIECIYKGEENPLKDIFAKSQLDEYAVYFRQTICWRDSPYTIHEKGRRKILEEMYDPGEGEYASMSDAEELYQITKETFDVRCQEVFTLEQWKEIIQKKECMLYKENGQIVAYYVWRLEGKKLYSNLSVNRGSANHLYNIERFIFEKMWKEGVRVYYAWYNTKNSKTLRRGNSDAAKLIKSCTHLYNGIFVKN